MPTFVFCMKSGFSFEAEVKSILKLVEILRDTTPPDAVNSLYYEGGVVINVTDISCIYPLESEHTTERKGHA